MNQNPDNLKAAIKTLLCNEKGRLLEGFDAYGYDDLVQYLEICRRVQYSGYRAYVSPVQTSKTSPRSAKDTKAKDEILKRLTLQDPEAAKLVLADTQSYATMQIKMAESILQKHRGKR